MRLSSLRAVQFGLGTVLVFAPLVLAVTDLPDARAAATIVSAALGLVMMALAVATPRQGDELPPRNRMAIDRALVVVLVVAGVIVAVLGDVGIGGICVACGLILGILASGTDYRERQGSPGDGATTVTSEPLP